MISKLKPWLLALLFSSFAGCAKGSAVVVVSVTANSPLDVSILRVVTTANGTASAPFDVRPPDGAATLRIPPAQTFGVEIPPQYLGTVSVHVTALDSQSRELGEAEDSTTIGEGETKTIELNLSQGVGDGGTDAGGVIITPPSASLAVLSSVQFSANVPADWAVQEGASGGSVDSTGLYVAPAKKGTYHVVATSKANSSQSASATVSVLSGVLELLAGQPGGPGSADGLRAVARFNHPQGIATDSGGNIYIADSSNACVRKISVASGIVTTFVGTPGATGTADGIGSAARFSSPQAITSDGIGSLFVADSTNHTIRQVNIATATVVTLAGKPGLSGTMDGAANMAQFNDPLGVAFESGDVYVSDTGNHTIRKIALASGIVSTLAGQATTSGSADGTGGAATFKMPFAMTGDGAGNLYVADTGNTTIRRIVASSRVVTTIAGTAGMAGFTDGMGAAARFNAPWGVAFDAGNLYIGDSVNKTIRKMVLSSGAVSTIAGTQGVAGSKDGVGALALFTEPTGIGRDPAGNIYVADNGVSVIRKLAPATADVTTFAGLPASPGSIDGTGVTARFDRPAAVASDGAGFVYVADTGNNRIRRIELATGTVSTLTPVISSISLTSDGAGNLYSANSSNQIIEKIVLSTQNVSTLVGSSGLMGSADGVGAAARFFFPFGVAYDGAGSLYVCDTGNKTIRKIDIASATVSTIAGAVGMSGATDGVGAAARFSEPRGIAVGGGNLYIGDRGNATVRKMVLASSSVTTLAGLAGMYGNVDGIGSAARFSSPQQVALDTAAGFLYVADEGGLVRRIEVATGSVTTTAGMAGRTGAQAGPLPAILTLPFGVALLPGGDVAVTDFTDNAVFRVRAP